MKVRVVTKGGNELGFSGPFESRREAFDHACAGHLDQVERCEIDGVEVYPLGEFAVTQEGT